jgi:hypothetical protein
MATKRNLKRQMRPPKDHFEKLLEVTYPNHTYPVQHMIKDCTVMRNFMTSGAFSKGRKPREAPLWEGRDSQSWGGRGHDNF